MDASTPIEIIYGDDYSLIDGSITAAGDYICFSLHDYRNEHKQLVEVDPGNIAIEINRWLGR
jgi:hypothetical protein